MPEHFEKKFAFKITWTPHAKTHTNACCVFFALEFFEMLVNCWKVVGYQLNIHLILFWKCWCLKHFLHWPVKVFIQKTTRNLKLLPLSFLSNYIYLSFLWVYFSCWRTTSIKGWQPQLATMNICQGPSFVCYYWKNVGLCIIWRKISNSPWMQCVQVDFFSNTRDKKIYKRVCTCSTT